MSNTPTPEAVATARRIAVGIGCVCRPSVLCSIHGAIALALTEQAQAKIDLLHSEEEMRLLGKVDEQAREIERLQERLVKAEEIIYGERGLGTALKAVIQCVVDNKWEEGDDPRMSDGAETLSRIPTRTTAQGGTR